MAVIVDIIWRTSAWRAVCCREKDCSHFIHKVSGWFGEETQRVLMYVTD
jgi:hypothetical protein